MGFQKATNILSVGSKGLVHIDNRLPIYICTDACKEAIGGYLYHQKRNKDSNEEQVVCCMYFSRTFSKDGRKWLIRLEWLFPVLMCTSQYRVESRWGVVVASGQFRACRVRENGVMPQKVTPGAAARSRAQGPDSAIVEGAS